MSAYIGEKFGNYRLLSLLARGGFAEVYLGEHVYLKSKAAIKVLLTQLTEQNRENFLVEARTLVNLKHPHIVRILDYGTHDQLQGLPFLVMEYAPNSSLRHRHPRGTHVPLADVVNYVKQMASALQYAHDYNIVHRDTKPENMLIGQDQEILLTDFGIALTGTNSRTQTLEEIAGTVAYMAPEQIQGKPSPASDQYALGTVSYEWLVGQCPFKGTYLEISTQHLVVAPPSIRGATPEITPAVEQVIMTALAKDYKSRFRSIQSFADALEQAFLAQHPTLSWPIGTPLQLLSPHLISPSLTSSSIPTLITPRPITPVENVARFAYTPPPTVIMPPLADAARQGQSPAAATRRPDFHQRITTPAGDWGTLPPPMTKSGIRRRSLLIGAATITLATVTSTGLTLLLTYGLGSKGNEQGTSPSVTSSKIHPKSNVTAQAMFGLNPQHTRYNASEKTLTRQNVNQLKIKWATLLDGVLSLSSPAVVDGIVYIGSHGGYLYAVRAENGEVIWKRPMGDAGYSSPAVTDTMVYIGSADRKIHAFDKVTGEPRWSVPTGGGIISSPAVVDGVLYIGSQDGKLYALDAQDGELFWTFAAGDEILSSPAVYHDLVYVGSQDSIFYAIDIHTGKPRWKLSAKDGVNASPMIAEGMVHYGAWDGMLYIVDAQKGRLVWSYPVGDFINSTPSFADNVIYFGAKNSNLYAMRSGAEFGLLWECTTEGEIASSATIANGVLYVGSWDHRLYAMDAQTGDILWNYQTGDGIESSPTVVEGVVYVGSRDRRLYAFALA